MLVLEWMGMHALLIFTLATSNVLPVVLQGFYWKQPGNNIVIIALLWLEILFLCDWFLHLQYCKLTNFYLWQLRFIGIGR